MALYGNGTDQELRVADNAALTLPDSNWSRQFFIKFGTITSTDYFTEHGSGATNVYEIYINSGNNQLICHIVDGSGNEVTLSSSSAPGADKTNFQHVLIEREGDTFRMCIDSVEEDSEEFVGFGSVNPDGFMGVLYRASSNGNFLQAHFAEAAQFNVAVFSAYGSALANGLNPEDLNPVWHIAGDGFPTQELTGTLTIDTIHNLPAVTAHPNIGFSGCPRLVSSSAQRFEVTFPSLSLPVSLAIWGKSQDTTLREILSASDGANGEHVMHATDNDCQARSQSGGGGSNTGTVAGGTSGAWNLYGNVFWNSGTPRRAAYINGSNKGTNNESRGPGSVTKLQISANLSTAATDHWNGGVCMAMLFSVALDDDDWVALWNGGVPISPYRIASLAGKVYGFWPQPRGAFLTDMGPNGLTLTSVNSAGGIITRRPPNIHKKSRMMLMGA